MGLTPQQALNIKYDYYEVFDKNKHVRYGITSDEEKIKIEEKYPNKYSFEKFDLYDNYIGLEKLEKQSRIKLKLKQLSFYDKILLILVTLLVLSFILSLVFPDKYPFIRFAFSIQ